MDQKSKPINIYGALAISILVTVAIIILIVSLGWLFEAVIGHVDETAGLFIALPVIVMFILLPVLLAGKYGWQTVVATIILQSLLLPLAMILTVLVTSGFPDSDSSDRYTPLSIYE